MRCLLLCCCLVAAASPTVAAADHAGGAATAADLQRQANEAAARHHRARSEYLRLGSEVAAREAQVSTLEGRMASLREATTRGAAALYMRDAMVDSVAGLGDGAAMLGSARRMKLMGEVNGLAGAAVRTLDETARRLRDEQRTLEDRRRQQEQAVARIASERRAVEVRLAALAKAERENRAREAAAARQAAAARPQPRTSRAAPPEPAVRRPAAPGSFICPINGPVAFSDDFGGRRNHKGNDLMNPKGTENVAVVAGTIETRPWSGGGIVIFLRGDDGHMYIYMHLLRIVGPVPRHVEQGEVVGLTGATGNATAYHTHFEFRPGGGAAVNPYPLVAAHC